MPKFVGPVQKVRIGRELSELWWDYRPMSKTVVKKDGLWKTVVSPHEDFLASCEVVLRGGFVNDITPELATELTAAGFGQYIVED